MKIGAVKITVFSDMDMVAPRAHQTREILGTSLLYRV